MESTPNNPNPLTPTSAKRAYPLFLKVPLAFLLTTVLLAGYIWLHVSFSYLDADDAARTSISPWYDIIVTWLIAVIVAFVIGRISAPRWPRLVLLLISSLILLTFILSCAELLYLRTNQEWIGLVKQHSWIAPFREEPGIPSDLSDTIVSENDTEGGVALSFLSAANTFRELNWYWTVVPIVDPGFTSFPGWLPIIELNVIFSAVLTLVGGATAVIATALHDVAKSIAFTNRILEAAATRVAVILQKIVRPLYLYRPTRSDPLYTSPYRASRWLPRRLWDAQRAVGALIIIFLIVLFISLTLFTTATLLNNQQVQQLTWETQSIHIPSYPIVKKLLLLNDGTLLASTNEGLFRSDDEGQNWKLSIRNPSGYRVEALVVNPEDGTLFVSLGGLSRSVDGGQSWERASSLSATTLIIDPRDGTLFAGGYKEVSRSNDRGESWEDATDGLTSTTVDVLVIDSQDGTLFAGTDEGIFRSSDRGESWQATNAGLTSTTITALVVDPRDGTLFAGTEQGLFYSADGGQSWQATSIGLTSTMITELVVDPRDGALFAGTEQGVFYSADRGQSWNAVNAGLTNTMVNALVVDSQNGTLFAGTYEGVFRSANRGQSWQVMSTGLTSTTVSALAIDPQDGTWFAGTLGQGVFRSTDRGQSWQAASAGLTSRTDPEIFKSRPFGIDGFIVKALMVAPRNRTLLAGTTAGLFSSSDGGQSWQTVDANLTGTNVSALLIDPQDGALFAGTDRGVFHSTDGGENWQKSGTPGGVRALIVDPQNGTLFAGTLYGLHRSTDKGRNWTIVDLDENYRTISALVLNPQDGTLLVGAPHDNPRANRSVSGDVFRLVDGGQNWQATKSEIDVGTLVVNPRDGTWFASTPSGDKLFRSTDQGRSWQPSNLGSTDASSVWALVVDPQDGTLLAGTNRGVFGLVDGGDSWEAVSDEFNSAIIQALVVDPRNNTLFVGTDEGVFRSADDGQSWEPASVGLTNKDVKTLVVNPQDGTLFAGGSGQVFRSNNGAKSWDVVSASFEYGRVRALAVDPRDGTLFAGTSSRGVFRLANGGRSWEAVGVGLSKYVSVNALAVDPQNGTLVADTNKGMFRLRNGETEWAKINPVVDSDLIIGMGQVAESILSYNAKDNTLMALSNLAGHAPVPIARTIALQSIATRRVSEGELELITIWGSTLGRTSLDITAYTGQLSGFWLAIRYWASRIPDFRIGVWLGLSGMALILIIIYGLIYTAWGAPYNVSVLKFVLVMPWRPSKLVDFARPALEQLWPTWRNHIQRSVLWWGDVIPADLRSIPRPYRRWALQQYLKEKQDSQPLDMVGDRLRLLAGGRPRKWLDAWVISARELHEAAGLTDSGRDAIDRLAEALRLGLGLELGEARNWGAVRAFSVQAPALRLNLPPSFPLIFLADPAPTNETVKMLSDCVDVLRKTGYFALVVPLEPLERTVEIAAELKKWLRVSQRVDDFIILTADKALDILSARDSVAIVVQQIVGQVNLKTISPFKDNGPCPPNMFFGREREIRQIVEGVGRGDFAVIGNRKAGKTSLLRRVQDKLCQDNRFYPLFINCQNVRDTADFYREFETRSGLSLPEQSAPAFEQVVRTWATEGALPILLLDEVDALLDNDAQSGEKLSGTWRKLAQDGVCHFVFVGTATLAQRLRNAKSVFFNFAQQVRLKYLPQDVAKLVIAEPMQMLGLTLQPHDEVVEYVVDLASGHPNLLQTLGKRLVEQASDNNERLITLSSCERIAHSSEFTDFYLDTIWGIVEPLEKLVTLVAPDESFEIEEIEDRLASYEVPFEPEELDEALEMLQVYAILQRENRQYRFNPKHFREIVQRTLPVERLINKQKRQLARQQQGKS